MILALGGNLTNAFHCVYFFVFFFFFFFFFLFLFQPAALKKCDSVNEGCGVSFPPAVLDQLGNNHARKEQKLIKIERKDDTQNDTVNVA